MIDGPWGSYRWHWFRMWPILPGLLVHAIPGVHQLPDLLTDLMMAAATALVVLLVISFSARSWRAASLTALVIAVLSGMNAWIAYQLYLA